MDFFRRISHVCGARVAPLPPRWTTLDWERVRVSRRKSYEHCWKSIFNAVYLVIFPSFGAVFLNDSSMLHRVSELLELEVEIFMWRDRNYAQTFPISAARDRRKIVVVTASVYSPVRARDRNVRFSYKFSTLSLNVVILHPANFT